MVANGAIVLHRSVVGTGAIVAANAVVLYDVDVPPGALAVGAPATIKPDRARTEEITNSVEQVRRPVPPLPARAAADRLTCWPSSSPCRPARPSWRATRCGRSASWRSRSARPTATPTRGPLRRAVDVARRRRRGRDAGRRGVPEALAVAHGRRSTRPSPTAGERTPCRRGSTPTSSSCRRGRTSTSRPDVLRVEIDPGAAFGLGDHPTTVLSLRLLREVLWPGASVLDVGCGSGVLGIVAARLGAPVRRGDRHLAGRGRRRPTPTRVRNGVAGIVVTASTTRWRRSTSRSTSCWPTCWRPSSSTLAADLRRVTAPAGALVVSGVLEAAHDHVVEALAPMHVVDTARPGGLGRPPAAALISRRAGRRSRRPSASTARRRGASWPSAPAAAAARTARSSGSPAGQAGGERPAEGVAGPGRVDGSTANGGTCHSWSSVTDAHAGAAEGGDHGADAGGDAARRTTPR